VAYLAGGLFVLVVAIPLVWRFWLWRHDEEYSRVMSSESEGRIVEPSTTEPWIRLFRYLGAKRRS
jgi:hypothetical protein